MESPQNHTKKRLVSGIKPTGRIHLGNYLGALRQFVALQDEYDSFIFVANLHALTGIPKKENLISDTNNVILDYLGAGLDPQKVTLFKQSDVPAHANLAWIFECLATVPYLERAHAYKDAEAKGKEVSVGTFNYPMLMAADILLYDADVVPVGKDQRQHVEIARDMAAKFNNAYGELFKEPKELVQDDTAIVPGVDGQKMSKSYNNTIPLFGTPEEIKKAVMSITTDSKAPDEPKEMKGDTLYTLHSLVSGPEELEVITNAYKNGGMGYKEIKERLAESIEKLVAPMRERRAYYEQNPNIVREMLLTGAMKAIDVSMKKLTDTYEAVGLTKE